MDWARRDRLCRIPYDLPPGKTPKRGDYLVSVGKRGLGSAYFILNVRQVRRRKPQPYVRWLLACRRASLEEVLGPGEFWPIYWYRRDRKRATP